MAIIEGGDKLAKALEKIATNAKGSLKVGFLEKSEYPITGTKVAAVAFWNEYGHGGPFPSPARPFFRPVIAEKSAEWGQKLGMFLARSNNNGTEALTELGNEMIMDIVEGIDNADVQPISEVTKLLRDKYRSNPHEINASIVRDAQREVAEGKRGTGGTAAKPLHWTGVMRDSVQMEVSE